PVGDEGVGAADGVHRFALYSLRVHDVPCVSSRAHGGGAGGGALGGDRRQSQPQGLEDREVVVVAAGGEPQADVGSGGVDGDVVDAAVEGGRSVLGEGRPQHPAVDVGAGQVGGDGLDGGGEVGGVGVAGVAAGRGAQQRGPVPAHDRGRDADGGGGREGDEQARGRQVRQDLAQEPPGGPVGSGPGADRPERVVVAQGRA